MATPFIGQILMFAGNFAPQGYLACDGSLVSISNYDVLFNLIGTTYGGDGVTTFGLPNASSRAPIHQGSLSGGATYVPGQMGGAASVTLVANQLGGHTHLVAVAAGSQSSRPGPTEYISDEGSQPTALYYAYAAPPQSALTALAPASIAASGSSEPHSNLQPVLAITICIAWAGVYPSQS